MAQAVQAPTTILSAVAQAGQTVHYIPEIRHRSGNYFPELHKSDTTLAMIVADIASAQHDDVDKVFAFDLDHGTCWDASKEVAYAVMDSVLAEYGYIPQHCVDFLEDHLGVAVVAAAERVAA